MAIGRNLMLAILSLDSYNRDYGRSVKVGGTSVGDAVIRTRASFGISNDVYPDWQAQGFYAIAYDTSAIAAIGDDLTIAYRGTDFVGILDPFDSPLWRDIIDGWTAGAGLPSTQATLALDFYNAVAGYDPQHAEITTTGHSLGGGLAGLAANFYGQQSAIFDHMPYGPVSLTLHALALVDADVASLFYGDQEPWPLDDSDIDAISTEGEVLSLVRLDLLTGASDAIPSHGGLRSPVDLHSMSMLSLLIWAQDNDRTEWQSIGPELWDAFFDGDVAAAIPGIAAFIGDDGTAPGTMQTAIAYSVLESGERPFGDTAVWALFDDADELGAVIADRPAAFFDAFVEFDVGLTTFYKDIKQSLADLAMQFAGALAIADVEGNEEAKEGVLARSADRNTLVVDASDHVWAIAAGATPINLDNVRDAIFAQTDENWLDTLSRWTGLRSLEQIARVGWQASSSDIFDRFHLRTNDAAAAFLLTERSYGPAAGTGNDASVDVFVGSGLDEEITGTTGNDLLFGSGGGDTIRGRGGDDVIDAGSGDDSVEGGSGRNVLIGGDGGDVLHYDVDFH